MNEKLWLLLDKLTQAHSQKSTTSSATKRNIKSQISTMDYYLKGYIDEKSRIYPVCTPDDASGMGKAQRARRSAYQRHA
jgi:tetrahydromethanopterin S-methyltransferase subunit H